MDTATYNIKSALERINSQLAGRGETSLSLNLDDGGDEALTELVTLINQYSADVATYMDGEAKNQKRRSDELMQAYNALQAQNDEVKKELTMARNIQQRLLPQEHELPKREELRCFGYYSSMSNVGGDLYDIIRVGRNSYAFLIADVSGHGIPAALITSLVKIAFRTKLRWGVDTAVVCDEVNRELHPILSDLDYFVTAFLAILNLESGKLQFTNCGHHPGIMIPEDGSDLRFIDSKGRFLGPFDDTAYDSGEMTLSPGDGIFLYTDGISEARNLLDEEYTTERMLAALKKIGPKDPDEVVRGVYRDLDNFCMSAEPRDDRSMLAARFYGTTPEEDVGQTGQSSSGGQGATEGTGTETGKPATTKEDIADSLQTPHEQDPRIAAKEGAAGRDDAPDGNRGAPLIEQAETAIARKDWNAAVTLLRAADLLGGINARALFYLARIYYRARDYEAARDYAARALVLAADGSLSEAETAVLERFDAQLN